MHVGKLKQHFILSVSEPPTCTQLTFHPQIVTNLSCACADHMTCTATDTFRDIQHYWIEQLSRNGTDRFTTYSVHQCPHCPSLTNIVQVICSVTCYRREAILVQRMWVELRTVFNSYIQMRKLFVPVLLQPAGIPTL